MIEPNQMRSAHAGGALPSDSDSRCRVISVYRRLGFLAGNYARLRFLLAPMVEVARLVPAKGDILDLGCGHGIFANLLAHAYPGRRILGVDMDAGRIRIARQTCDRPNIRFLVGDACDLEWDSLSIITMIDLLHHMPYESQESLLKRVFNKLPPRGTLLIKDLHTKPMWKYLWHYAQDSLSYRRPLYFRSTTDMTTLLEDLGFRVRTVDLAAHRPHPHIAYVCTRAKIHDDIGVSS